MEVDPIMHGSLNILNLHVAVDIASSKPISVLSGVPQGPVADPVI